MTQACKTDFMLVGKGFALDGLAEQTRLGWNLTASPASPLPRCGQCLRRTRPREPGERRSHPDRLPRKKLFVPRPSASAVRLHTVHATRVDGQGRKAYTTADEVGRTSRSSSTTTARPTTRRSSKLPDCGARSSSTTPRGTDPLRRAPGRQPDRLQPGLDCWSRGVHEELREVERESNWPTRPTSASATSRSRRPRFSRPWRATSPSSKRVGSPRPRPAGHVVLPPLGDQGQGVAAHPDPPVHHRPLEGDELERRRVECRGPARRSPGSCGIWRKPTTPSRTAYPKSWACDCSANTS